MNPDRFAYLGEDHNPTGFTNNFLESRSNTHLFEESYSDFPTYNEYRAGPNVYSGITNNSYRDILKTSLERDTVSDMFFSHKNMQFLKAFICNMVYKQSNGLYKITPEAQSDNSLLDVMAPIYEAHGKHLQDNFLGQVADLNYQVVLFLVPRTLSNIQQNLSYQRDQSQQPLPMDRPVYMSSTGTKSNQGMTSSRYI
jgi:hypothetical protein